MFLFLFFVHFLKCLFRQFFATVHYRYGLIYRDVLKTKNFEVCKVALQTDLFTVQIINFVESFVPGAFKPCPRTVSSPFMSLNFSSKFRAKTLGIDLQRGAYSDACTAGRFSKRRIPDELLHFIQRQWPCRRHFEHYCRCHQHVPR